jgi:hypothetical protein
MTYSVNDYQSQDYGVGVATADNIMGKWSKYPDNPVLQKPNGLFGSGHHCLFKNAEGKLCMAFHAHKSYNSIHPREMYITTVEFRQNQNTTYLYVNPEYAITYLK